MLSSLANIMQVLQDQEKKPEPSFQPISELKPNTYVFITSDLKDPDLEKFRAVSLEEASHCYFGYCNTTIHLYFDKKTPNASLLAAYIGYQNITFVDDEKNLHKTIKVNAFFATQKLRDQFIKSLPNDVHVFSNERQNSFYEEGIGAHLLAKTRNAYIAILNQMFTFPEAELEADMLFKHGSAVTTNFGVTRKDILSLNKAAEQQDHPVELNIEEKAVSSAFRLTKS